jgi:putative acetyltransferase
MSHPNGNGNGNDVIIRSAEPEDYEGLRQVYAQPGVYFGTLQLPLPSSQMWKDQLAQPLPGFVNLVACLGDQVIGNIGLHPGQNVRRRHTANIGMGVHDDYAGNGVGQQLMDAAINLADNWHNLLRLELTVYTDNDRAIRLYKRCGFEQEGVLRKYAFRDGGYIDALTMARFKSG